MNFNSFEFAIFLPTVFVFYWLFAGLKIRYQNLFILLASFVFYGWVDFRFLGLIIFSILLDYFVGLGITGCEKRRRRRIYLSMSIIGNLGMLCYFKYYNFFVDSIADVVSIFGYHPKVEHLNLILPLGISFYTFQTMSYSIDNYRRKMTATKDILAFGAFVSFFPQLVAGPIERAERLLPQFLGQRRFDYAKAVDGSRQILWGFFKKIVIADNSARILNPIFENHETANGSALALGVCLFAIQVYADFSGYSDIAIGTARLFGLNLSTNFRYPYFAKNIAEIWDRWHISLSTWFRDYLYFPLGGSRRGKWITIRNIFIVFFVSGLWHGAAWHYIFWGLSCAFFLVLYSFWPFARMGDSRLSRIYQRYMSIFTFLLALVFFRSESMQMASEVFAKIFSRSFFSPPALNSLGYTSVILLIIGLFFILEWKKRNDLYPLERLGHGWPRWQRFLMYYMLLLLIFLFNGESIDFVYFRF